jgi:hypothetical protein
MLNFDVSDVGYYAERAEAACEYRDAAAFLAYPIDVEPSIVDAWVIYGDMLLVANYYAGFPPPDETWYFDGAISMHGIAMLVHDASKFDAMQALAMLDVLPSAAICFSRSDCHKAIDAKWKELVDVGVTNVYMWQDGFKDGEVTYRLVPLAMLAA